MRLLCLSLLIGLTACQILGDPKDPNASTGATATADPDTTSTSTDAPSTGAPTTTDVTAGGSVCGGLGELDCARTPGCQAAYGLPLEFSGCTPQPAFLACTDALECDQGETTVCRDGSVEAYILGDTCVPAGFTVCDPMLPVCGESCLGLDEATCAGEPACVAHFGAPHIEQDTTTCVDFADPQFLACGLKHDSCPPAVVTACPMGQPDTAFDIASGCIPPGFEPCTDGAVPACP